MIPLEDIHLRLVRLFEVFRIRYAYGEQKHFSKNMNNEREIFNTDA